MSTTTRVRPRPAPTFAVITISGIFFVSAALLARIEKGYLPARAPRRRAAEERTP
jgi:hypothetical protein